MASLQPVERTGPARRRLSICLVAGEESGDRLGAALMKAIRERTDGHVDFEGVGGQDMAAQGLHSPFAAGEDAIIGFSILGALPRILRRIRRAAEHVVATQPDVLVIIDSPEFTHRVARKVRKTAPSIQIIDYVSPSVWAWRPWRARAMRSYVDHVLALLPFEPDVHARLGGPACSYVGHPAIEAIAELRPDAQEAARRASDPPLLLVLPGSRSGEIRRMLGVFGETIELLAARGERFELALPTVPLLAAMVADQVANWRVQPRVLVELAERRAAFRSARAALAKSGTVTLELALAGVPTVAAYKVSLLDEAIARMAINVPSIILANLVLGENIVPEILQRDCTPAALADAIAPLLHDTPQRRRQLEAFTRLDAIMEIGQAVPSQRAADIVLGYVKS